MCSSILTPGGGGTGTAEIKEMIRRPKEEADKRQDGPGESMERQYAG